MRKFWAALKRDIKIASAVSMALLGLLLFIDKYWPDVVSDRLIDFVRWVASLGSLLGL